MSNRQERKARKAAVRAGDTSQRLEKEPKRPTASAPTRDNREKARRSRSALRKMLRDPITYAARVDADMAKLEREVTEAKAATKK